MYSSSAQSICQILLTLGRITKTPHLRKASNAGPKHMAVPITCVNFPEQLLAPRVCSAARQAEDAVMVHSLDVRTGAISANTFRGLPHCTKAGRRQPPADSPVHPSQCETRNGALRSWRCPVGRRSGKAAAPDARSDRPVEIAMPRICGFRRAPERSGMAPSSPRASARCPCNRIAITPRGCAVANPIMDK